MAMIEAAATRSPRTLVFKESSEADSPVKKRAGIVPIPNANIVRNPPTELCVVAAFIIMAQESMQGKNPAASPRAILLNAPRERKRGGSQRLNKDRGPVD